MNKADRAEQLFKCDGLNCAQAVACAFSEETGIDISALAKISSSFGGGVARTGEICGAVSGICMIAGLLKSKGMDAVAADKPAHYAQPSQDYPNSFFSSCFPPLFRQKPRKYDSISFIFA